MEKETMKVQTEYQTTIQLKNGDYETLDITQEENVVGRDAIKIKLFDERWRNPKDMIELLRRTIVVIEETFI